MARATRNVHSSANPCWVSFQKSSNTVSHSHTQVGTNNTITEILPWLRIGLNMFNIQRRLIGRKKKCFHIATLNVRKSPVVKITVQHSFSEHNYYCLQRFISDLITNRALIWHRCMVVTWAKRGQPKLVHNVYPCMVFDSQMLT